VLYGCEAWSLTLREESRLRVFENRILRRIFGPKRDENGEWRKLHNENTISVNAKNKVNHPRGISLYHSPNIVLYCIEGVIIAVQCTATFSRYEYIVLPRI
jgi:hypothetical protein